MHPQHPPPNQNRQHSPINPYPLSPESPPCRRSTNGGADREGAEHSKPEARLCPSPRPRGEVGLGEAQGRRGLQPDALNIGHPSDPAFRVTEGSSHFPHNPLSFLRARPRHLPPTHQTHHASKATRQIPPRQTHPARTTPLVNPPEQPDRRPPLPFPAPAWSLHRRLLLPRRPSRHRNRR